LTKANLRTCNNFTRPISAQIIMRILKAIYHLFGSDFLLKVSIQESYRGRRHNYSHKKQNYLILTFMSVAILILPSIYYKHTDIAYKCRECSTGTGVWDWRRKLKIIFILSILMIDASHRCYEISNSLWSRKFTFSNRALRNILGWHHYSSWEWPTLYNSLYKVILFG
jgi:hypothetical protein